MSSRSRTPRPNSPAAELPGEAWERLEQVLHGFEAAWHGGRRPAIEDYLQGAGGERRALLVELVHAELELRLKAGQPARVEDYLGRFAELRDDPTTAVGLVAAEYRLRRQLGGGPAPEEYLARFPDHADALRCDLTVPHPAGRWDAGEVTEAKAEEGSRPGRAPGRPGGNGESAMPDTLVPSSSRPGAAAPGGGGNGAPPQRLGKFQLVQRVGAGAFGTVWKARDTELGRTVALKLPHDGLLGAPGGSERFLREARAAAQLRHPNIVTIHEVVTAEGRPAIVAEFIEGVPLKDLLAGRKLTCREAAALVAEVAEALDYAHLLDVVHRDIKPGNILVEQGRGAGELAGVGRPLVTDFGLALREDAEATLTLEGDLIGTPLYMSPEQASGHGHWVDRRSDVFSLGVVLYELLTGERPFGGSRQMILHQVLHQEPRRPRRLNAQVPRDLETVCLKCLEKDPARRYHTARQLAEDLRRYLAGEPVRARPLRRLQRAWRWCLRNPTVAVLAASLAVLLLAVTIGSVVTAVLFDRARHNERTARLAAENALVDAYTASGLTAAERGEHPLALLWFANAARLARNDPRRELADRIRVQTWRQQLAMPVRVLAHPDRVFRAIAFHPRLPYLLTVSTKDRATLWDLEQEKAIPLPGGERPVCSAAWSPDGRTLALGTPAEGVGVFDFPSRQPRHRLALPGKVADVTFSPDGKYLALAGGNVARVWDVRAGAFLAGELTPPSPIRKLVFNAKADRLVCDCANQRAWVHAITNNRLHGEPLFAALPHVWTIYEGDATTGRYIAPVFLDQDRALLTLATRSTICWWDARTGRQVRQLHCPRGEGYNVESLAVSKDGSQLAVGYYTGAQFWDLRTAQPIGPFSRYSYNVTAVDFQPGQPTLLIACRNTVRLRSTGEDGPALHPLPHTSAVHLARFSPGGHFIATAEDGGVVRLWGFPPGNPSDYRFEVPALCTRVVLSRDGDFVLPRGVNYRLADMTRTRVHEAGTGRPAGKPIEPGGIILDAAFSPDGASVAVAITRGSTSDEREKVIFLGGGRAGNVQIWDWRRGTPRLPPVDMPSEPRGLDFSPDGRHVAVLCATGELLLLAASDGRVLHRMDGGSRFVKLFRQNHWNYASNGLVRFSPDGTRLVSWGTDETAHVWDTATGKPACPTLRHEDRCYDVQFSPAGDLVVTASFDRTVRVWGAATGRPAGPVLAHPDRTFTARFSPDAQEVLTACQDGTVRIWNWRTGQLSAAGMRHDEEVFDAAFVPGKPWVVTTGRDRTFRLWDRTTGQLLMPPRPLPDLGLSVCVTPDGRLAIVAGFGGAVHGFDLDNVSLTADAAKLCTLAEMASGHRVSEGGNVIKLTAEEWLHRWQTLTPQLKGQVTLSE
jgi:WD40 repeat protein